jgi:hypothetical protein
MTDETIMLIAGSPVALGIGAAMLKGWQAWRAHVEKMDARKLELDELRIKTTHEEKLREIAADETTGRHELEGYREISKTVASAVAMAMVEADRLRLAGLENDAKYLRARDEACQRKLANAEARLALVEQVPVVRRALSPAQGTPAVVEIVDRKDKDR